MMVLKQFQKNLFHKLRSLAKILWNTGVLLAGKRVLSPFITNFLFEVANQAKHLFISRDNFYYILIESYISLTTFGRLKHKILNITTYM